MSKQSEPKVPARQEYKRTGKAPTPANTGAGGKASTPKTK